MANVRNEWAGIDSEIAQFASLQTSSTLRAYEAQPNLIEEHVRIEQAVKEGGYSQRQVHELVQNASDAIQEAGCRGAVRLVLTESALYCANEGAPIDQEGVKTILGAHLSRKQGAQIGHFGLGFKSVLAVTSDPRFYSRSGSFGFHGDWALEQVRKIRPDAEAAAVLRLGRPVDVHQDASADDVLNELLPWATTVVKLPIDPRGVELLADEFASFPAEFLLFASHVSELVLDDRCASKTRTLHCKKGRSEQLLLQEGRSKAAWRVFATTVATASLPPAALADAPDNTRKREELPLMWAVPLDAAKHRSRFWAFFPTETETTLSGILNAPWKTNSDRQNLLEGAFNSALLDRSVDMIARAWPALLDPDDPGRLLDLMTARPDDAKGWADRYLAVILDARLSQLACVPGRKGELAKPESLRLRPDLVLRHEIREWLQGKSDAEAGQCLVDLSVEQRERRPRAARLGVKTAPPAEWLGNMASRGVIGSVRAIRLVDHLESVVTPYERSTLLGIPIVLAEQGGLFAPSDRRLLLEADGSSADVFSVSPQLLAKADVVEALERWGVARPSPDARLERAKTNLWSDAGKREFWNAIAEVSRDVARKCIEALTARNPDAIHVRSMSGQWRPPSSLLLPGAVVPADGSRDASITVDTAFHAATAHLLPLLGLDEGPVLRASALEDPCYQSYRRECASHFRQYVATHGPRPHENNLVFDVKEAFVPLSVLPPASDEAKLALTEALLPHVTKAPVWTMRHTSPDRYPVKQYRSMLGVMLQQHGLVRTSLGTRKPGIAVTGELAALPGVFPVAEGDADCLRLLGTKACVTDVTEPMWKEAWASCQKLTDAEQLGRFYALAAPHSPPPEALRVQKPTGWGAASPADTVVVTDIAALDAMVAQGRAAVLAPDQEGAELLEKHWGLTRQVLAVRFLPASDECRLDELVVTCAVPEKYAAHRVQLCDELWFESSGPRGAVKRYVESAIDGDVACVRTTMSDEEIVTFVTGSPPPIGPGHKPVDVEELMKQARFAADTDARLLIVLDASTLRTHIPSAVLHELETSGPLSDRDVAGAALAVFGVQVLREYQGELAARGLPVPSRWSGSPSARAFVEMLGFSQEFAGFEPTRLDPMLEVEGPVALAPLHEFQRKVADKIIAVLADRTPGRGLVSLPTGAGKTRVTVQALIEAIVSGTLRGTVLWVAQSEELCEQAVQAWRQAWRALGPPARLRISRLWGGTNNRVVPTRGHDHVVVATFQSLGTRIGLESYAWLREPACVVIDEAHGAVTKAYTEILEQLGLKHNATARPLIGLTATPFRGGEDQEETERLANRFYRLRLDHGVFADDDPYEALQDLGVLARADHEELEGAIVHLSNAELSQLEVFKVLPPEAARRLGESATRNRTIVDSIRALDASWPVLVFATSVDHAFLLAALLSAAGIPSKAISGQTDVGARRHYIREFREGRLRVLTNYGVLTTGFDAPSIRALYVTRPVFSRGLYQQMLGRGLRGPLNGGKERCLIVNVNDNVSQYGEQLAFRHFEHLWDGAPARA
jgi:superfamily II DNA or RNA helicase